MKIKQIVKIGNTYLEEGLSMSDILIWLNRIAIIDNIYGTTGKVYSEEDLEVSLKHYKHLKSWGLC